VGLGGWCREEGGAGRECGAVSVGASTPCDEKKKVKEQAKRTAGLPTLNFFFSLAHPP